MSEKHEIFYTGVDSSGFHVLRFKPAKTVCENCKPVEPWKMISISPKQYEGLVQSIERITIEKVLKLLRSDEANTKLWIDNDFESPSAKAISDWLEIKFKSKS